MKTKNFPIPVIAMLIKWSGLGVTDGRNKIGGTVLSRSRSGATARNKVTPINRRTRFQSKARAFFTGFSQAFSNLTAAQIIAWNNASAAGFTLTNIFGDAIHKSGKALFVGLNINLANILVGQISDPPSPSEVPAVITGFAPNSNVLAGTVFALTAFGSGIFVVPATTSLLVWATPPLSRGVSFVKSQYRLIAQLPETTNTSTFDLDSAYRERFGVSPIVGNNVKFAIQAVNRLSGISGTPWNEALIIT